MDRALSGWQANLTQATSYLASRSIGSEAAEQFQLGVVSSPEPGWERYVGRLAIPYFDRLGPVGFTFRCLRDHSCKDDNCPKYLQMDGQEVGFFNVLSLDSDGDTVHVCEGEIDAITLSQIVPDPVLALSGVAKWKPHFPYHLAGFERVVLWPDGDVAGKGLAVTFRKHVSNVDVVNMPAGEDVNSLFCSKGADALKPLYMESEDA